MKPAHFCIALSLAALSAASAIAADIVPALPSQEQRFSAAFTDHPYWEPGVTVRDVRPSTNFAHKIPLTLIDLDGSTWTTRGLLAEIRTAEAIYAQCEVSFGPIVLINATSTYDVDSLDYYPENDPDASEGATAVPRDFTMVRNLALPRPLVIYKKTGGAYSFNAVAIGGSDYYRDLLNVVFVPADSFAAEGDTQTRAHELGHVLLDEDHNNTSGNILYCDVNSACAGETLTPAQCEKARSFR